MSYVDDILFRGKDRQELDANLNLVLKKSDSMRLHVDANKMQLAKERILSLDYDIQARGYYLNTYISEKSFKILCVSSKQEIRKIVGALNVCKGVCPNLHAWVEPLHSMLKARDFLSVNKLKATASAIWSYVLHHNTPLSMSMDSIEFYLMVDWSARGVGYALFAGHPSQAVLVGINSKGFQEDVLGSFLGELKRLVWALNDTKCLIQGRLVVFWTDSQSVFKRLIGKHIEPKKM